MNHEQVMRQVLEALCCVRDMVAHPDNLEFIDKHITALRAALAEPEGQREKEIEDLRFSLDFYQRRCEALQSWQSKMRDPERTIVCDILANGFTLDPAFAGDRYTAPPQRKPLTDKQKLDLATNWFAENWAIAAAIGLLHDYDTVQAREIGDQR